MIRRVLVVLLMIAALMAALFFIFREWFRSGEVRELRLPADLARHYAEAERETGVSWAYLAAIDEVESGYEQATPSSIRERAGWIRERTEGNGHSVRAAERAIRQGFPDNRAEEILEIAESYRWMVPSLTEGYAFPFRRSDRDRVSYSDTWGAGRTYGGDRKHEGTDLMAKKGIPILSVADGVIVRKGWNRLGGWAVTVMDRNHPQIFYYYAHMSRYGEGIKAGQRVERGQVIGYVGDSGYGPKGTTGKFPPHLHFGIYVRESLLSWEREAINPYPLLKVWEAEK
ncbi:M23 family metallopeptidase [Planifilum fimeticola]|uniref:M23 family metallopeptidase n=1 Tax=Planifilum fimeticola TaxID=201975 RepID=UPI0011B1F90D|nr:M23 family metallopeptidase [Planifilum fimeticola]